MRILCRGRVFCLMIVMLGLVGVGEAKKRWTWLNSARDRMSEARHDHGMVEFGGRLIVIGGKNINGRMRSVEVYDPRNGWAKRKLPPFGEVHHFQPVVVGDQVLVGCAWTGAFPRHSTFRDIWSYEPRKDAWKRVSSMPASRARGACGAAVYRSKVYYAGGNVGGYFSTGSAKNFFDEFDPKKKSWKKFPAAPTKRDHGLAAVIKGKLYLCSGRDSGRDDWRSPAASKRSIDVFDFGKRRWSTLAAKLPLPGAPGAGLGMVGKRIVLAGGERQTSPKDATSAKTVSLDTTYTIKTGKGLVKRMADLNRRRNGLACAACGGTVYCVGGANDNPRTFGGGSIRVKGEYDDMESRRLSSVPCKLSPRRWFTSKALTATFSFPEPSPEN